MCVVLCVVTLSYIYSLRNAAREAALSSFQASRVIMAYQQSVAKKLKDQKYSMLFVGDIMLSRSVAKKIYESGNPLFPFLESADFLRSADITFGNLEGPISERGTNQGSVYSFRDDPKTVDALTYAGFDVMSLANNHILDWGNVALQDTLELLHDRGIQTIGAGRNDAEANAAAIVKLGNAKIAFLGYTKTYPKTLKATPRSGGISDFDEGRIKKVIEEAKRLADIVVVSFHWGVEYRKRSTLEQQNLAHSMIDWGADIIVGHHPHVVEEVERYKNGWIAYSLGNFVFDQDFSRETMESIALKATIKNKKIVDIVSIPININSDFQPHPVGL